MNVMHTSLRRAGALVASCIGLLTFTPSVQALEGTFSRPTYKGLARLDNCYSWGRECGQRAADTYCRVQGYERAVRFTTEHVRPTRIAVDGRVCDGSFCVAFATITCSTSQPKRGQGVGWPQRID